MCRIECYGSASPAGKTVLIDESGDMGRNVLGGASIAFTITATVTSDPKRLAQIAGAKKKNTKFFGGRARDPGKLKHRSSARFVRKRMLRGIKATDSVIYSVVVAKKDIPSGMRDNLAYHEIVKELMGDVMRGLAEEGTCDNVRVKYDSSWYLTRAAAKDIAMAVAKKHGVRVNGVEIGSSKKNRDLQAADFSAGAIGRRYNAGDDSEFRIIAAKARVREGVVICERRPMKARHRCHRDS